MGTRRGKFCYVDTAVSVMVDGVALPVVTAESEFDYFGVRFNWMGIARTPLGLDQARSRSTETATKFLRPRLHHSITFGRHHKAELVKGDKSVRRAVHKWLRLPADCPNSAIHSPAKFGGLGVASLELIASTLKDDRLSRFTNGYAEDAPIASHPSVRYLMTYRFRNPTNCTREGLADDLNRFDTRGLSGYDRVRAGSTMHPPTWPALIFRRPFESVSAVWACQPGYPGVIV